MNAERPGDERRAELKLTLDNTTLPAARTADLTTSQNAAVRTPGRERQADKVLADLRRHGPSTDHEGAARLGIGQSSYGKRRLEAMRRGYVVKTGMRRPTGTGYKAVVWRALESTEPGFGVRTCREPKALPDGLRVVTVVAKVVDRDGEVADVMCADGRCRCELCDSAECRHVEAVAA